MDDFSFPTIQTDQDSSHHFPIWFLSNEKSTYRRSFSSVEGATRVSDPLSDDEGAHARARFVFDEDKMDLLWEDFNEEVRRVSCELKSDSKKARLAAKGSDTAADFCVLKGNNSLLRRKKPSLVVMIKVLKKMFLVQKISSMKKGSVYLYLKSCTLPPILSAVCSFRLCNFVPQRHRSVVTLSEKGLDLQNIFKSIEYCKGV